MADNSWLSSTLSSSSTPCNRKCCKVCSKFVYLHQPVLFCFNCLNVFHGKCLDLYNDKVFYLQQVNWSCRNCSKNLDNNITINVCTCCDTSINIYVENFLTCNNCLNLVHKTCTFNKTCLNCIPEFIPSNNSNNFKLNDTSALHVNELNTELPYFSPFSALDKPEILDHINTDDLSDAIKSSCEILASCKYLETKQFVKNRQQVLIDGSKNSNVFGIVSLNIDGVKSNFDKFKIFVNEINTGNYRTTVLALCETNVTLAESQPYYLNNYNKFVLDKIKKGNSYKKKGSGLITFVDNKFKNVSLDHDHTDSSADGEFLCVKFKNNNKTYFLLNVYRPPSGNVENFINKLEIILVSINLVKQNTCYIFGDFNLNLYNPSSNHVNNYLDIVFSSGLFPLISRATHFMGRNPTCIDHILCNDVLSVIMTGVLFYNVTHHMPVFTLFSLDENKINSAFLNKPRVLLNEHTLSSFYKEVSELKDYFLNNDNEDNNNSAIFESAEKSFSYFLEKFKYAYDTCFIQPPDFFDLKLFTKI